MGLKVINPLLKTVAKKAYVAPKMEVRTLESLGLKMEQLTGDVAQFNKVRLKRPTENQVTEILKRNKINPERIFYGDSEEEYYLIKSFINENNNIFLEELERLYPFKEGTFNTKMREILIYLENINHSHCANEREFLTSFIKELENINFMKNAKGEKLFEEALSYSKKAILQAKYNNPDRYKEIMDLYQLVKSGKAPDYILRNLIPEGRFHALAKGDIQKLLQGKHYFEQFTGITHSSDVLAKTQLGEAFSIGDKMFVRAANGYEELKFSKAIYERLFPPIERYALAQTGETCFFVAPLDGMIKNPKTRIDMYNMFEQIDKNTMKVTLPGCPDKPVIFSLSDLQKYGEDYVSGAPAYKLIEECYAKAMNSSVQTMNLKGGNPEVVLRSLYAKNLSERSCSFTTKDIKHEMINSSKGSTCMVPEAMIESGDYIYPNIGIHGAHAYSTQNGYIFNPENSIEAIKYPEKRFIYSVFEPML